MSKNLPPKLLNPQNPANSETQIFKCLAVLKLRFEIQIEILVQYEFVLRKFGFLGGFRGSSKLI